MNFSSRSLGWQGLAILVVAAALRLWALDLRPPHFDEGVNGWFADQITQQGYFRYDPTNYHGPLHFYAVFVCQTLFGRNEWALRLPAVLAGVLTVWALLRLREFFGGTARWAALAAAVSPTMVFHSRYSIHESWLAFFLVVTLFGVLGLREAGSARFLGWTAAGLAGMVLTKETYVIHVAALALAFPCLALWERAVASDPPFPRWARTWTPRDLGIAVALGTLAIVLFYSGLFLDFSALKGLYETFAAWTETGFEAGGHEKPAYQLGPLNFYWLALFARYEPVALLGVAGCFAALWPCAARLRYVAILAAGTLLAYSLIPYKTPWCLASIAPPFFLVADAVLLRARRTIRALCWPALLAASLGASIWLTFHRYAHDDEPLNYVQTYPEIRAATAPLLVMAAADPRFLHAPGAVILESYYPLPWLLGDFTSVGYYGENEIPERIDAAFVLTSAECAAVVESRFASAYFRRPFRLRSGVGDCVAYFRQSDFESYFPGPPDVAPSGLP